MKNRFDRRKGRKNPIPPNSVKARIPKDFSWKLLSALASDLKHLIISDDYDELLRIIRSRDYIRYKSFCEQWTLQCIGQTELTIAQKRAYYQLASLLKKFPFPDFGLEARKASALKKFYKAEATCQEFNMAGHQELQNGTDWAVEVRQAAEKFLRRLLGARPSKEVFRTARHGPGASLDTVNGQTSAYNKYAEWPYSCTSQAAKYAQFVISTDQRWYGALQDSYREKFNIPKHYPVSKHTVLAAALKIVDYNKIAFVPKDAQSERTIAIEPTMNLYLQLGVDGFIRSRLKQYGVNLDSQRKNSKLARLGSIHRDLVTLDLSAASDSLSLKLCEMLLPTEWYTYLCSLRCPKGLIGDEEIVYHKISSMGNGYTFALESAIFTAVIYSVYAVEGRSPSYEEFAVYGDDLIVPYNIRFKVIEALRIFGFSLNLDKSFLYGASRESCGADWIAGTPVRPIFLRNTPTTVKDLYAIYNRLKRILELRWGIDVSVALDYIFRFIPEDLVLFGPYSDEEFDTYLHTTKRGVYKNGSYRFRRFIYTPKTVKANQFFFRKLMVSLKPQISHPFEKHLDDYDRLYKGRLESKSRAFDVLDTKSRRTSVTNSTTYYWWDEYNEDYFV